MSLQYSLYAKSGKPIVTFEPMRQLTLASGRASNHFMSTDPVPLYSVYSRACPEWQSKVFQKPTSFFGCHLIYRLKVNCKNLALKAFSSQEIDLKTGPNCQQVYRENENKASLNCRLGPTLFCQKDS